MPPVLDPHTTRSLFQPTHNPHPHPQTDSGPDNDSKETHAFHWLLIHMGVFQKIVWIRLKPHHSHNLSDRANSFHKEVMTPKRGTGGGCKAPWEMDSVVKKALQSQAGMCVPCLAQHTLPVVHARCCTHTRVPMMT